MTGISCHAPRHRFRLGCGDPGGLAGIAVLIGLGTWQVDRLAWKEALLASIDQRTHAAPRPLAEVERQFAGDWRRRLLAGRA